MDKFLLGSNPLRPEDTGLWIIHMLEPFMAIQCFDEIVKDESKYFMFYEFRGKTWTLSAYKYRETGDPYDVYIKVLDRAWRWLRAYLERKKETK